MPPSGNQIPMSAGVDRLPTRCHLRQDAIPPRRERPGFLARTPLNRLDEPHGIQFFDDWIDELKAAYNVRVIGE
jgi:hypothetical protein